MNIEKLKELLVNKLVTLNNRLNTANITGNIEDVMILQDEIAETTKTLEQLTSLATS